jgi:hypothetical protein
LKLCKYNYKEIIMTDLTDKGKALLSNTQYDVLDKIVKIGIPGLTAFYAAIAGFWGWGHVVEIVGTGAAVTALGGVFLQIATSVYNKSAKKIVDAVQTLKAEGAVIQQPGDSQ